MDTTNKAIFVSRWNRYSVQDLPIPEPRENEVLVNVLYSGINPADLKHPKYLGIRDTVIGDDFCGRVLESRTPRFQPGDLVAGYTPVIIPRPVRYGTHQAYLCCPDNMCYKVPSHLPQEDAAALTVVAMTAADALFNHFALPLPTESKKEVSGPLLIWGASTSVGLCAVQYARSISCEMIIVTASSGRHELLRRLGATHCFDYSSPTVIQDIQRVTLASGKGPVVYAFDAVGSQDKPTSAAQIRRCAAEGTILVSVVHQLDSRYKMPVAVTHIPFQIKPYGMPFKLTTPARPESHWRAWEALAWAIDNYGPNKAFHLPRVTVVKGTGLDMLQKAQDVADGKGGFGKLVIQQPFD